MAFDILKRTPDEFDGGFTAACIKNAAPRAPSPRFAGRGTERGLGRKTPRSSLADLPLTVPLPVSRGEGFLTAVFYAISRRGLDQTYRLIRFSKNSCLPDRGLGEIFFSATRLAMSSSERWPSSMALASGSLQPA